MSAIGLLGSADIPITTNTLVATMGEPAIICIRLCNRNAARVAVRIAIGVGANPATTDYLEFDTPLDANQPLERTGISVSTNEKIWIYSDTAGISARVDSLPST